MYFKIDIKKEDGLSFIMEADSISDVFLKMTEMNQFNKIDNKRHYYEEEDSKIVIVKLTKDEFKAYKKYTFEICEDSIKVKSKKVFNKYEVAFYGDDGRSHRTIVKTFFARNKKEAKKQYKNDNYHAGFNPLEKA